MLLTRPLLQRSTRRLAARSFAVRSRSATTVSVFPVPGSSHKSPPPLPLLSLRSMNRSPRLWCGKRVTSFKNGTTSADAVYRGDAVAPSAQSARASQNWAARRQMISMAAIPVAGRTGGHASSSRLAHAAKAFSSASSAAESGGVVATAGALLVTGASDQRRRLRSAAEDMFFRVLQPGC